MEKKESTGEGRNYKTKSCTIQMVTEILGRVNFNFRAIKYWLQKSKQSLDGRKEIFIHLFVVWIFLQPRKKYLRLASINILHIIGWRYGYSPAKLTPTHCFYINIYLKNVDTEIYKTPLPWICFIFFKCSTFWKYPSSLGSNFEGLWILRKPSICLP